MKLKTQTTFIIVAALVASFLAINITSAQTQTGPTLTVNIFGPSGSSVNANSTALVNGTATAYTSGDFIELTPVAVQGWSFNGWSGNLPSTENATDIPLNITITSDTVINAAFLQDNYTLTMYTVGQGTVSPGNQTYPSGTVVDLEAINAENWTFSGWSGDATGTTNTTITLDGNKTVTATFNVTVTATPSPSPSPTPAPTATPSPSPTATASPSPTGKQASTSAYLAIAAAVAILIILGSVIALRRRKGPASTGPFSKPKKAAKSYPDDEEEEKQ